MNANSTSKISDLSKPLPTSGQGSQSGSRSKSMDEQVVEPRTTSEYLAQAKTQANAQRTEDLAYQAEVNKMQLESKKAELELRKMEMEMQNQQSNSNMLKAQMDFARTLPPTGSQGSPALGFLSQRLKKNRQQLSAVKSMSRPEVMAKFSNNSPAGSTQNPNQGFSWGSLFKTIGNQAYNLTYDTPESPLPNGPIVRPNAITGFLNQYRGPQQQIFKAKPAFWPQLISSLLSSNGSSASSGNLQQQVLNELNK